MSEPFGAAHPHGEQKHTQDRSIDDQAEVDTFDGKVFIEWDPDAAVTPQGQLPFFIEFLKLGHRFEPWIEDCPLYYKSNNAPKKIDVLGSIFLSILSGHNRFSHVTALQCDSVNSKLLGMNKVVSDDSARRALKKIDEDKGVEWLKLHLQKCYEPLLGTPWILDCDVTVKPIYGRQEGAVIGYNPHKKGRPSHTYHTYMIGNLRIVLDVEVQAGNQSNSSYSMPGLTDLLERINKAYWPAFVRGDCDWGSDKIMRKLETMDANYLFKIKKGKSIKSLIYKHHCEGQWQLFKDNWEAKETVTEFGNHQTQRRIILMRRRIQKENLIYEDPSKPKQLSIGFIEDPEDIKLFEYSVLVTNLDSDIISILQHYRDRADCENVFDEMKNQWGWGGYTTKDLKTSQFMSRIIALIYNWWNLFVRLVNPTGYQEAITSRPFLLSGVGRLTQSGRQKKLSITSQHGWGNKARHLLTRINQLFSKWKSSAPQLNPYEAWKRIIDFIVAQYVKQKAIDPPKPAILTFG